MCVWKGEQLKPIFNRVFDRCSEPRRPFEAVGSKTSSNVCCTVPHHGVHLRAALQRVLLVGDGDAEPAVVVAPAL